MRPGDARDPAEVPLLHSGPDLGDLSEVDKDDLSSKLNFVNFYIHCSTAEENMKYKQAER